MTLYDNDNDNDNDNNNDNMENLSKDLTVVLPTNNGCDLAVMGAQ